MLKTTTWSHWRANWKAGRSSRGLITYPSRKGAALGKTIQTGSSPKRWPHRIMGVGRGGDSSTKWHFIELKCQRSERVWGCFSSWKSRRKILERKKLQKEEASNLYTPSLHTLGWPWTMYAWMTLQGVQQKTTRKELRRFRKPPNAEEKVWNLSPTELVWHAHFVLKAQKDHVLEVWTTL